MKRFVCIFSVFACNAAIGDTGLLTAQIERAKYACVGISDEMSDLKTMAGINTAVTAVGTVAGGVALGTGLAKANVDAVADEIEAELQKELDKLNRLAAQQTDFDFIPDFDVPDDDVSQLTVDFAYNDYAAPDSAFTIQQGVVNEKQSELDKLTKKSKSLGNIRTGTLAGAAVADTAGTIIAANNRVKGDLQSQIDECIAATKELAAIRMQERINGTADTAELDIADNIVRECGAWETIDLSKINKRATGAAISAGTGAALAIAGTITSASANSNSVRSDDTESGKKKEKNLNTASNVLAGGTTAASAVATVFNATQISTIKRAAQTADKCEEAFNQ